MFKPTFRVEYLPLYQFSDKRGFMKSTILIVSSDSETRSIAERVLSHDYELIVAKDGAEGISQFEANLSKLQMVILDTTLSDMLAQDWIKTSAKHYLVYTILMAADRVSDWMVESMKAGAMDIVRKEPFYETELVLAVKQGFDYTRMTRYLERMAEHNQNKMIQHRIEAFFSFLKAKKSQWESLSPNEIALYFPSEELNPELPLEQVVKAIETGETYSLIKKWKHRPKLLIVDDEDHLRETLYCEFVQEFEVILASSCEEAMRLSENHPEIDLAILDIAMPDMSGDDFVPILKQKFPKIQILMLSGYSEYRLISKTINFGAGDYVLKPYDSNDLRQRVFGLLQSSILNRVLSKYMQAEG